MSKTRTRRHHHSLLTYLRPTNNALARSSPPEKHPHGGPATYRQRSPLRVAAPPREPIGADFFHAVVDATQFCNDAPRALSRSKPSDRLPERLTEERWAQKAGFLPLAYRGEQSYSHHGNREKQLGAGRHVRRSAHSPSRTRRTVSRPQDLIQGTLDLLVLKMLALNSMNGWDISQRLKQISKDALQVSDGSLYPALHKLEQEGWITAEWRPSENNRRAKFYSLTRAGRKQLQLETNNWDRLAAAITAVVRLKEV